MLDRKLIISWIRLTWLGWLLGVPIITVLALIGEAVGIGGSQSLVGVGMGTGIGLMQGRVIRRLLHKSAWWVLSSIIGLGVPFLVTDISKFAGWNIPYSLFASIAIGGLIVGCWQSVLLRSRFDKTKLWVVGSLLGWTLAALPPAKADSILRSHSIRGIWGALAYLGFVAGGGLILGAVTGIFLAWIARNESTI